ncbi:MAG: hypothetical protein H9Q65_05190 [Spiroplasma ixodetis]|nr:hypothetical protein [Spiroplasma ixodetis]MBP1527382.1 hypothetical protein [Spiroplasma ixodetis]MBP1528619.1 hypothetical protein [Spiroplasma ixodetis]
MIINYFVNLTTAHIQTYLLTEQIQQNNFLNNNEKSKYRNKTHENEKKSQIIRFK